MSAPVFNAAARRSDRRPAPFSIRLSPEERAALEAAAGSQPLGAYMRDRLLGPEARPRRKRRTGNADTQALAQVLAALGQSRLSSNLNQLSKAAHLGALAVTTDTEAELREACSAVQSMRRDLMRALGYAGE